MSFTYEGNASTSLQWLPLAVTEQQTMQRLGLITKNINPATGVHIHIQNNHIHIKAGVSGYEFSIHAYGGQNDFNHMDVFYFLDSEPASHKDGEVGSVVTNDAIGSPYQDSYGVDHSTVQENHINMWLGDGATMTGCVGQRYGGGVGFSSAEISDRITERFPRYVKDRVLLWEGDADVTAAAQSLGVFIGVTMTGTVYIWNNDGRSSQAPLSGVECYWVFNKAGTECSGINYSPYQSGVDRVATIHTLKFSGDSSSINIEHSSYEVHRSTYAVDYDSTRAENELITCEFETYDRGAYTHFPGYSGPADEYRNSSTANGDYVWFLNNVKGDPFATSYQYYYYMESFDITMVLKSATYLERVPFAYNYGEGLAPLAIPDPSDVSYIGKLLALDLRFRSYCISTQGYISNKQYILNPNTPTGHTDIVCVVDGAVVMSGALYLGDVVGFNGMATPTKTGAPDSAKTAGSYIPVRLAQVMAVSPELDDAGLFIRTNYTGFSHDIDFLVSDGTMFGSYHKDIRAALEVELPEYSDFLISTYNSWV